MTVELRIRGGLPAPQGIKEACRPGDPARQESSKKVKPWRTDIVTQCWDQYKGEPMTGPLEVEIIFWFPRPKTHYRTALGKRTNTIKPNAPTHTTSTWDGDIDKVVRSTLDKGPVIESRWLRDSGRQSCGAAQLREAIRDGRGRLRCIHSCRRLPKAPALAIAA